ncbi:MAG TPA: S-layer homology domain-containing protein [bacterium]|jgi:hypothetical protein|nr:S-layer homology domain-containing protein [bacterium]
MGRTTLQLILGSLLLVMIVLALGSASVSASGLEASAVAESGFRFVDIEDSWARDYIEQMAAAEIIKGVSENRFAPKESAENVQILTMLVRVLGLEDEMLTNGEYSGMGKVMAGIPVWARGYVRVAMEEGIITEPECRELHLGQKATRLDVATYISRIIGEDGDYWQDDYDAPLANDLRGLDKNLRAPAVRMIKKGIMVGTPEGDWLPHNLVGRDQMAKIMALIMGPLAQQRGLPPRQVYGRVVELAYPTSGLKPAALVIENHRGSHTYPIASDCFIRVDGLPFPVAALEPLQRVWLMLTETDGGPKVVYVKAETPLESEVKALGIISKLSLGQDAALEIATESGDRFTFQVQDNTFITLDGKQAFLGDLRLRQQVELKAVCRETTKVALDIGAYTIAKEVEGIVSVVVTKNSPSLSLTDAAGTVHTIRITGQTKIRLNGELAVLEDLRPGDRVGLQARDEAAMVIEAWRREPEEKEIEGTIVALVFKQDPSITIQTAAGSEYTYRATPSTEIRIDGQVAALDALRVGSPVRLRVKGDEILLVLGGFSFSGGE